MATCAPLPVSILQRIQEFMAQGRTGQVALNFRDGALLAADIKEHLVIPGRKTSTDVAGESRA